METALAVASAFKAVAAAVGSTAAAITGSAAVGKAVTVFVGSALGVSTKTGLAAALGSTVGQAVALSFLQRAMVGKPKLPSPLQQVTFTPDPQAPREMLFGLAATSGTPVLATTHGSGRFNNALLTYVSSFSSMGPVDGVNRWMLGEEEATFNGNGSGAIIPGGSGANHLLPGRLVNTQWKDWVYYQHRLGDWGQSAIQFNTAPGELPEWTSAHKGSGTAHYAITYWVNPNLFQGGAPPLKLEVRGFKNLRNPVDLSVGYSAYPADIVFTLLGAITAPTGVKVGALLPDAWIDREAYAAWRAHNVAHNQTMGGVYRIDRDSLWEFLKGCFQAGGAQFCVRDGKASVTFDAARPVVYTIRESDLAGEPVEEPLPDRKTRDNRLVPKCWSPADKWTFKEVEAVENSDFVTQDRGRRQTRTHELPFVHEPGQARKLTAYELVKSRQPVMTLPVKPHMAGLGVGDVVTIDLAADYGITWARAVVLENDATIAAGGSIKVRFEPANIHTYANSFTATDEPSPTILQDPAATVPSPVGAASATAVSVRDGGYQVPAIRCQASLPAGTVGRADFRIKPAVSTTWENTISVVSSAAAADLGPVRPRTLYNVEARFVLHSGVEGAWAALPSVTTGAGTEDGSDREFARNWTGSFIGPLQFLPETQPEFINTVNGQPGMSADYVRKIIARAMDDVGIRDWYISQCEWNGYAFFPFGGVLPTPWITHANLFGLVQWWRNWYGVNSNVDNIDFLQIIKEECEKRGGKFYLGLSRFDDTFLWNELYRVWAGVNPDPLCSMGSLLFLGGTNTAVGSKFDFLPAHVGAQIREIEGPGVWNITGFNSAGSIEVSQVTAGSGNYLLPGRWRITGGTPLANAQTMAQRRATSAGLHLAVAARLYELHGSSPSFGGWYFALETDHIQSTAPFVRQVVKEGATYNGTVFPPLSYYGGHVVLSGAGVIDLNETAAAGQALRDAGVTIWQPQDGTGAGTNLDTGAYQWQGAGEETNLRQLGAHMEANRRLAQAGGVRMDASNEIWLMEGTFGYTNAFPCAPTRPGRQFVQGGSRGHRAILYTVPGFAEPADIGTIVRLKQNQSLITDYRTRAEAVWNALVSQNQASRENTALTITAQWPVIEIRQGDPGNVGTRTVTHVASRSGVVVTGGTWQLLQVNVTGATGTVNASTGTVSLSGVAISGSYVLRYTHTDGLFVDQPINVTYLAAPVSAGRRVVSTTASGVTSNTYANILSVTLTDAPAGVAQVAATYLPGSLTGTSTSFQFRLLRDTTVVWEGAAFLGIDGSGAATAELSNALSEGTGYFASQPAGTAVWAFQGRRTAGTGSIGSATGELVVDQLPG